MFTPVFDEEAVRTLPPLHDASPVHAEGVAADLEYKKIYLGKHSLGIFLEKYLLHMRCTGESWKFKAKGTTKIYYFKFFSPAPTRVSPRLPAVAAAAAGHCDKSQKAKC